MKYIQERIAECERCDETTLQRRNSSKINWPLHIFMCLVTVGLWLPIFVLALLTVPIGGGERWSCSLCGKRQ